MFNLMPHWLRLYVPVPVDPIAPGHNQPLQK
jgi:hypothetical protein